MLTFLLILCLTVIFNQAKELLRHNNRRSVDIQSLHSYVQLLVDRDEISTTTAKILFTNLDTIATVSSPSATCDGNRILDSALPLNVTVNNQVHTIYASSKNRTLLDRIAAKFCIATGIPAEQCITIRNSLVTLSLQLPEENNNHVLQINSGIPAVVLSPSMNLWQFTKQRVYFNISLQFPIPSNNNKFCYHIDFDSTPQLCGSSSKLISELAYLPRPSYTRSAFRHGWHVVSVQPYSLNYSSDFRFFYVAEPFITITSASLQYMSDSKYFITARIKIGDFRVGVDGTYCMLLDWQVVSCSDNGHTTPTTPPTIMEEKKSVTDKGGESVYHLDVTATIESHRRNHRVNVVSFILLSTLHHSKSVAVSESYEFSDTTKKTVPNTNINTLRPQVALTQLKNRQEWGLYSQNGEDGIVLWIFSELGILSTPTKAQQSRFYVEFGVEDGYECNTRILREHFGWKGLLMDGSHTNASINLRQEFITAEDINHLFSKYNVPSEIDFLSIDIDFNDYWVLKSILNEGKYSAKVIAIEYNSHVPANESRSIVYNATGGWDGKTDYSGAGTAAIANLGEKYGYRLIYCESHGVNAFLIRKDLISRDEPIIPVEMINRLPNFFGRGLNYPHGHGEWVFV